MVTDKRAQAEEQVEAFLTILVHRYGISEDEIPDLVESLKWTVRHRRSLDRISWHIIFGVLSAVITAVFVVGADWLRALSKGSGS